MSKSWLVGAGAGILVLGAYGAAVAQVPDAPSDAAGATAPAVKEAPDSQWRWTLGLGAAVLPEYEGADEYTLRPVPLVRAQKGPINANLLGLHLTSNVIPDAHWRFGPSLFSRRGYDGVDEKAVRQLDVDRSFEIGAKGGYDFQFTEPPFPSSSLSLATEALVDVSDTSNGYVITPSATYRMLLSERWDASFGAELTYASDGYMSYYFGVSNGDAAKTGLDSKDADAGVKDAAFKIGFGYALTESWRAGVFGQYKRLFGDAEDSPIVDDKGDANNFAAGLIFSYSW